MASTAPATANRHRQLLYVIVYGTMFFFGVIENIKGVSFPLIKSEFGVNYDSQGGLVSMTWFGYVLFCLVASLFLQRFGLKRSISIGYLLICIGAIATLAAPSFWAASAALLIVNAGFGFFEVGANALATVVFTSRAALMMNLMHFFYGFGAIVGPKTAGLLTGSYHFAWRQVYIVMIVPVVLFLVFILLTRFNGRSGTGHDEPAAEFRVTFAGCPQKPTRMAVHSDPGLYGGCGVRGSQLGWSVSEGCVRPGPAYDRRQFCLALLSGLHIVSPFRAA